MRALTHSAYGRPSDVLHVSSGVDKPTPEATDVLVKVQYAALNPADWHAARGLPRIARLTFGLRRPTHPGVGSDFVGQVVEKGDAVSDLDVGDIVFGSTFGHHNTTLADFVRNPASSTAKVPEGVTPLEACALGMAGLTALQALRTHAEVRPGQKVLVVGASGGVGSAAVQIANALGANSTGVCSAKNLDFVRNLGAANVYDYNVTALHELPDDFDVVLQLANQSPRQLKQRLQPTGILLLLAGDSPKKWFGPIGSIVRSVLGSKLRGPTVKNFTVTPTRTDLEFLASLVAAGDLAMPITSIVDLDGVPTAIEELENAHTQGKVCVQIQPL